MWWSASWVVTSTFHSGLTDIDKVYLLAAPISSLLELQSKSWVVELELELLAPRELTQSCGSDSAFRKGLAMIQRLRGYDSVSMDSFSSHAIKNVSEIPHSNQMLLLAAFGKKSFQYSASLNPWSRT